MRRFAIGAMIKSVALATVIVTGFPVATLAGTIPFTDPATLTETVILDRDGYAHSLHASGVDMVVYYTGSADNFTVVATYASKAKPAEAARFTLTLVDNAIANYFIPGRADIFYRFERSGEDVTVSVKNVQKQHARLR